MTLPKADSSPDLRPLVAALALGLLLITAPALAHDVAEGDKAFVQSIDGPAIVPFLYLGAKHMVTGYDHIAFLVGVVFFLTRLKDVVLYVSMFTLGHSLTLLGGVLLGVGANAYVIDAIIGLSVVYKGVENVGGFARLGWQFDTRWAVLIFGLFHGLGLATKVMDLELSPNGLLTNLIAFNIGVELGQVIVLTLVVLLLGAWRYSPSFKRYAFAANLGLILVGLALTAYQVSGYLSS
jgi:HupE / UreJ protein